MTLVQNLQQLLNGNKILVILSSILFIHTSCATAKRTQNSNSANNKNVEFVSNNIKKDSTLQSVATTDVVNFNSNDFVVQDTIKNKSNSIAITVDIVKDSKQKNDYKIAIVLPFILNQVPLSGMYVNDTTKQLLPESKKAMDFYLGCKMAKNEIETNSKNINVYFVDDNNSAEEMDNIIKMPVLLNADYIVAPFHSNQVMQLANFAKATNKILFVPYLNSFYATSNNPNFFNVTTSLSYQYQKMIEEIQKSYPEKTIEILYNNKDTLMEKITVFESFVASRYPDVNFKFIPIAPNDNAVLKINANDTLPEKAIIIYSMNETYIKNLLNKLSLAKNKLIIYTNNTIRSTKTLITAKSFKHELYITNPYISNTNTTSFKQKYIEDYIKPPTELSYLGYDILKYIISKIEKEESFLEYKETLYEDYLQSEFKFLPITDPLGNIQYYDNSAVNIYKWNNGMFVKL